ncbi:AraC-like DNA-binding protein [Flavobacterium sp. W4I14]|nr:AraC-like DNA-binding protein [Flavobacterium sp. W4I14]
MKIEAYIPTELLRPFIKAYRIVESEVEMTNRILPGTSLVVAFRYKGRVSYLSNDKEEILPASTISGLRKSVRLIHYLQDSATIVVQFKETGAKAFFNEPLYELFEESISLDAFIDRNTIEIIEEQLAEAQNNIQRIAIIEQFLLSRLDSYKPDRLISTAVEIIHSTKGIIRIKELADTLCISNDAFEKRFRKIVGTSPKQFSSIIRLEAVVRQKQEAESLAGIAFNAGYYDQPHFNKDFKLFTGQTPSVFYKSPNFW